MRGVTIQAQMLSQLLDAALGKARLIWVMPQLAEVLLIILWSSIGGFIIWKLQSPPLRIGALVMAIGAGYLACFLVFQIFSGWLPFVPIALVLIVTPFNSWLVDRGRLGLYKIRKYKQ